MIGGYFSLDDRRQIAEMWEAYQSAAFIACALMVDPTTAKEVVATPKPTGPLKSQYITQEA